MPKFSSSSSGKLNTCRESLQRLFEEVVKKHDCIILEGHRNEEKQYKLYKAGKSKVRASKHNHLPSRAVDVSPYPIPDKWGEKDFKEKAKFYYFAGIVMGTAEQLGINIRWGGNWDGDDSFNDQVFDDLVHFEIDL